ncbi:MAG: DivIVA domain-containing protein [Clostridia bacterium]|nr:DivIVA domain-containing protein [Clostridia bacterium]
MAVKRFKSSLSGYDKSEVDRYIQNVFEDFESKLVEKDEEINRLFGQVKELSKKYDDIKLKEDQIAIEKEKITKALVRADETYAQIIEVAKKEAKNEVDSLENQAESQREKIVDIKKELIDLKKTAKAMIEKYQKAIDNIDKEFDITIEEDYAEAATADDKESSADSYEYIEYQIKDDVEDIDEEGE